ncbi:very-long-chain (3R)-3-hydroxyacyl-CoA dehydratase-like protein [Dinothrombium tinctorium]|uniref:Very-long-chain (3R)-3-hydroxyacyl-CoA dehydratase n=1 Tax=Dinothrombium tinctorium TaxID=1965070 RepID=A0A3S3PQD4_9ACAR|nr:very-long-chain (3R)-3-hydroxyacyl-CoA dehydratase-like protein [Dinothrombium tinctorium]
MSEEWLCSDSKCNRWNAGHRSKCIACGKQRPPAKESGRQNSKFLGDWYCSRCGSVNWSRTQTCDMCNSPRFGDNIGDQQRKGFSETLEYISRYENVRRNLRDKDKDFGRRRKSQRLTADEFRRVYLFLYNLFQFVGYVYILFILSILYAKDGIESMKVAYSALSRVMKFLHLLQILDFLHALLGYTTGSALFAALHLINRLVMLFVMIDGEPRIQTKPVVFYLFALYTLMDVVRYPYYMFRVFKVSISLLTWLRYSMWMPLLPLISFSEGLLISCH